MKPTTQTIHRASLLGKAAAGALALVVVLMLAGCAGNAASSAGDFSSAPSLDAQDKTVSSSGASPASSAASQGAQGSSAAIASDKPETAQPRQPRGLAALSQYPELPNGCEVTSLAAVLNYYGFDISKTELSDRYLSKAPVGQANPYVTFVGDPRDDDAYGCYTPVLVAAANNYLSAVGSAMRAVDLTGSSPSDLYARVDGGQPVIVWATRYMEPGHYSVTWNVGGQDITWYTPEHCMVLVGYDDGTVYVADPIVGAIVDYDRALFETRYAELRNQAVVVE